MHQTGLQIGAATLIVIASVIGVALFARTVAQLARVIRLGQPDPTRGGQAGARAYSLFAETLGHARLGKWPLVGIMHWFVFVGFGALFFTLVTAYGQIFDPHFALPLVGHWAVYEWPTEIIAWLTLLGIVVLIAIRQRSHPKRSADDGKRSRFYGSSFWQAYYVELTILAVAICVLMLRGHEYALARAGAAPVPARGRIRWVRKKFRHGRASPRRCGMRARNTSSADLGELGSTRAVVNCPARNRFATTNTVSPLSNVSTESIAG